MGFQAKVTQVNDFRQSLSSASLHSITHGLFKFLTHDEEKEQGNDGKLYENKEIQYLEDCANATRGTEAYDQYEWLESDE